MRIDTALQQRSTESIESFHPREWKSPSSPSDIAPHDIITRYSRKRLRDKPISWLVASLLFPPFPPLPPEKERFRATKFLHFERLESAALFLLLPVATTTTEAAEVHIDPSSTIIPRIRAPFSSSLLLALSLIRVVVVVVVVVVYETATLLIVPRTLVE